ncbi:MAG: hypothetical protein ABJG75_20165 [Roseobacter sp.]
MPTIAFQGFTIGSTVTIGGVTVNAWGQIEGGGSVWDQTPTPGVSVSVDMNRSDHRVAPEGVFFSPTLTGFATNTATNIANYDPSYHDKVYFWDYGESYDYVAPTQVVAMDAADGGNRSDSRYSLGPLGSHVFRTHGIHTVRLAVLEPSTGRWGQAVLPVSVADPNDFYSGSTTIFVDQTGNYGNAPSGAQRFTSLTAAFSVLDAALTPHRILLERGQTHVIDSPLGYRPPTNASGISLRIEALAGTSARPVLQASSSFTSGRRALIEDASLQDANGIDNGAVISGIELHGTWDVTSETGNWGTDAINFSDNRSEHCVVDDCVIANVNVAIRTTNLSASGRSNRAYFVNDTIVSDWSNYGIFDGDSGQTSILGSRIAQNVDAITGGPKDDTHNNHGPYRAAAPNKTVFLSTDFFSSTGWSPINSVLAVQPAIRWNTSAGVGSGAQLNMQSCAIESAGDPIVLSAANNSSNSRATNSIIEGSIVVGGFQATRLIGLTHGGVTLRNNVLIFPDTQYNATPIGGLSRGLDAFVASATNGDGNGTDATNLAAPIRIYNNTLVNLSNMSTPHVWQDAIMGFSNVNTNLENNLIHAPNIGAAYQGVRNSVAFIPRYRGYRADASTLYTDYAPTSDSASIWVPEIGSPALGAALSEPNASTDFRGNLRPEPPSIGAFETD